MVTRSTEQKAMLKEIDRHVGGVIRNRRRALGMTQTDLASKAMVTFQQLQKQERGTNRVSASAMYVFAKALNVPPSAFFEGLPSTVDAGREADGLGLEQLWSIEGALQALQAYQRMSPRLRKKTIAMLQALADDGDPPIQT